jgi:copper(I)-binding protein
MYLPHRPVSRSIHGFASLVLVLCLFGVPAVVAQQASGHPASEGAECDCPPGVELVSQAWVRHLPPSQPNTAAYMKLRNLTDADLQIVGAETPVARVAELHDHVQDAAGVMRMREVASIIIPAGGDVELKPGGLHVMLIDLVEPLQEEQRVPLTLYLEGFEDLRIQARVKRSDDGAGHHHHSDHHGHQHSHDPHDPRK